MSYEFNDKENKMFVTFSERLLYFSISLIVSGVLFVLLSIISPFTWSDLVVGFILIAIGVTLYLPVRNFKAIVHSEGNDIDELVRGFKVLGKGFNYVIIATFALILMVTIGFFTSAS